MNAPSPEPSPDTPRPGRLPLRSWLPALFLSLLLTPTACGDDGGEELGPPEEPGPELLSARLVSPAESEGAVVLEASAERVRAVQVVDRFTRVVERVENGRFQAAVVRLFPGEIRFNVLGTVVDDGFPEIQVLQVADGDDELRGSLEGYRVELAR